MHQFQEHNNSLGFKLGQLFKQAQEGKNNFSLSDLNPFGSDYESADLPGSFNRYKTNSEAIEAGPFYEGFNNENIASPKSIDPYFSNEFKQPGTVKSWHNQIYGYQSNNDNTLRPAVGKQLANKGYKLNTADYFKKFLGGLKKRAPHNTRFFYKPDESSLYGSYAFKYRDKNNEWVPNISLGGTKDVIVDGVKEGPGVSSMHELEHVAQGRAKPLNEENQQRLNAIKSLARRTNTKVPDFAKPDMDLINTSASETPAVLSEVAHKGQQAKNQLGRSAINDVNVPLGPKGSGISLGNLVRDAKQFGHLGGNKSVTELLNTPEGQAWLRHWIGKHRNNNQ